MASGGVESLTEGTQNLSIQEDQDTIGINFDDDSIWVNAEIPRKIMVELILADKDVVLFGENNFTFTLALAAIQGGCDRILPTRIKPATEMEPLPAFNSIQKDCVINCVENGKKLKVLDELIIVSVKSIVSLTAPEPIFALCGIDPKHTMSAFNVEGKVVWYQCPWISLRQGTYATEPLITAFLTNMARQQSSGDYVLIGIITEFPYVKSYNLKVLLDFTVDLPDSSLNMPLASSKCSCPLYDFIGADDSFIEKILQFGYRHTCEEGQDIHDEIFHEHITLIFQRNDSSA